MRPACWGQEQADKCREHIQIAEQGGIWEQRIIQAGEQVILPERKCLHFLEGV